MARRTGLERLFDELSFRQTHYARRLAGLNGSGGRPLDYNGRVVRQYARKMGVRAEEILVHDHARTGMHEVIEFKRQWRAKGRGSEGRKLSFRDWYDTRIGHATCVYAFWSNRSCLYVGRTEKGRGRPSIHFEKHWSQRTTRVDVYVPTQARQVVRLECLATHRFQPLRGRVRPANKSYRANCPICDQLKSFRRELRRVFRVR